jgi:hypothetical protein
MQQSLFSAVILLHFLRMPTLESSSMIEAVSRSGETLLQTVLQHIQEGRFQRSLAFITAGSSIASTLEVTYEHYKGSYSNPVMYSPVILGAAITGASFWAVFSSGAGVVALRITSVAMLLDGVTGFIFHIRGIARKPGGWRIPIVNIVMGPPIFAPLLFGTAAYMGVMASYLQREGAHRSKAKQYTGWRQDLHHGRFQKHLSAVTALWTFCSGFEAWYSHYKSNFKYKAQWTPVLLSPFLLSASIGAVFSKRVAKTALPALSALALLNGTTGFFYHARGILRRPGGREPITRLHKLMYGPPIFAPLLFAACGMLGMLASLLRREGE